MQARETARAPSRGHRRIDAATAARAVDAVAPLIEHAMRDRDNGDSGFLHVVVMDPARDPRADDFDESILHERSFGGPRSAWDADYAAFARDKAHQSWRSGSDDTRGAVYVDGIVVGASGAFEPFDQAYAGAVAMWLRALARQRDGGLA